MTLKTKIIIAAISLLASFSIGRYSARSADVKLTEEVKTNSQTNETKNTHTKTTITETKQPDGADTKVTVIDQVKDDVIAKKDDSVTGIQKTVTSKGSTLNISILGANDFSRGLLVPTYGISVTKEVLGPITVGAFGLMNGVIGVSIGLDF